MALPIEEWISTHVADYDVKGTRNISENYFYRVVPKPMFFDKSKFFSPASGTIIHQKIHDFNDSYCEIKGKTFKIKDLLGDLSSDYKIGKVLVISIFLSFYDVHYNTMPMRSIIKHTALEPIYSFNLPMIFMEKKLFENDPNYKEYENEYLFLNSRVVNEMYSPDYDLTYFLVQIADEDIDVILHNCEDDDLLLQHDKFSYIKYGSQVTCIVPLKEGLKYKLKHDVLTHVELVDDVLFDIERV